MDRIVKARVNSQRWYERYPRAVPLGTFALTMMMTLLSVAVLERSDAERFHLQMRAVASVIASALEKRASAHIAYLRAGALLMAEPERVDPVIFRGFAQDLETDQEYRGGEGLAWGEKVAPAQVSAFEAARRAEGLEGFTVHPQPAPDQPFLVPVTYIGAPNGLAQAALGYDMYSEKLRREAMDRAAREHRAVATGKITLQMWRGRKGWPGFLIYMPVFARNDTGRLIGFICSPFNARSFLAASVNIRELNGFGVRLYDGEERPERLLAQMEGDGPVRQSTKVGLMLGQRPLLVVVDSDRSEDLSTPSRITLLFGTLVALLSMLMAQLVTKQAAEDRISLGWLGEQVSIRNSLTRELNHRVKNTLANVLSIIALTRGRATGLDDFVESLNGRIRALSATHDLLTSTEWKPALLRDLIEVELAPYTQGKDHVIDLAGPEVRLAPNDALLLGLAIHELATNASKYGALSVVSGGVEVHWELVSPDLVRLSWREHDGPPVAASRRRGFGTELLDKIVAHELGHGVKLEFPPKGVRCELLIPVRQPATFRMRRKGEDAGPAS